MLPARTCRRYVMGNISCVSCRTHDDKQERRREPTPPTDYVIGNRVPTNPETAQTSDVIYYETNQETRTVKHVSRVDPLLTSMIRNNANNTMSDDEVAASAIVQMTLFIATQVMYPAIERYLNETIARELELLSQQ